MLVEFDNDVNDFSGKFIVAGSHTDRPCPHGASGFAGVVADVVDCLRKGVLLAAAAG